MAFPNILPYITCKCFPSGEAFMKRLGYPLFVLYVLLLTTMFSGCDEFISIWHGGNGGSSITSYPMQIGNRWTYDRFAHTYHFRPIDSTYQFHPDSFSSTITVDVTRKLLVPRVPETTTDSILVTEFRSVESGLSSPSYNYYTQPSGSLLLQGYVPGSLIHPKPAGTLYSYHINDLSFRSVQELMHFLEEPLFSSEAVNSITREYPPLLSIVYPLTTGDQWTFRPQGRPWRIDKRTGALRWDLQQRLWYYEVRWLYDLNGDGVWDDNITVIDRISAKGLLGRTLNILDIIITSSSGPEIVGYVDMRDEYTVTSIAAP